MTNHERRYIYAGVIEEWERNLEYHDTESDDLVRALRDIPTKEIADESGYNEPNVRKLKRGEFRPGCDRLLLLIRQTFS